MSSGHRFHAWRIALVTLAFAAAASAPASAQGFFDFLFGGRQRNYETQFSNAYNDPAYPDPQQQRPTDAPQGTGRVVTYCVRTCDGRYFPMQRYSNANPAQLCNSFCPASKTQVYTGGDINYATAPNGIAYPQSENAFLYRKQVVAGCTCNGRDAFGLAPIDPSNDPTMRPGDIVMTGEGPMTLKGNTWAKAAVNLKTAPAPAPRTKSAPAKTEAEPQPDDPRGDD